MLIGSCAVRLDAAVAGPDAGIALWIGSAERAAGGIEIEVDASTALEVQLDVPRR